jgi:CheY-like chemotaxis protein
MLALLVDDNLMSRVRIEAQLRKLGYAVDVIGTSAALTSLGEVSPQLIVVNLGSRPLNGVSHLESLRTKYPEARLVGFCGHLEVDIRRAAKAAGIDKLLTNEQALSNLADILLTD